MRRWWCKKYQLPPTSAEYLAYTDEQLAIEFFEDFYEEHPEEALKLSGDAVQFKTGDPLIDSWEAAIARGDQPNLDEFFTPEENKAMEAAAALAQQAREGFHDDYAASQGAASNEGPVAPPLTTF